MPKLRSPIPGYGQMTAARRKSDYPPPPWPLGPDPRTPDCTHHWTGSWGVVGERQHFCTHCERWIWEHEIWAEGVPDGQSDTAPAGAAPQPTDSLNVAYCEYSEEDFARDASGDGIRGVD